ncbi:MAG: patatin-like phospholipase family protein [Bacteroidales bacterium]|nr:patatin-like phospholipase family protein [Candidatus Cacconaster scatequi]
MKKAVVILFLLLAGVLSAMAARPRVALVLSGGGAKGAAHVGVIKVLEEKGVPIDMVVGTSMGAVIGGLYCAGYSGAEMDSLMMIQDWNRIIFDGGLVGGRYLVRIPFGPQSGEKALSAFPSGLVRGTEVEALFERLLPGVPDSQDFDTMPTRFACVSVDLVHKKEVVHHSGNLIEAIRASMSIPLFFEPVRKDGMVLIDGGMLNNYPVDVARAMGADIVIGVKVGEPEYQKEPEINDMFSVGDEWLEMYLRPKTEKNIAETDIFIGPSIGDMNVMSFQKECIRQLIDNGEAAAREVLPQLEKLAVSSGQDSRGTLFDPESGSGEISSDVGSKVSLAPAKKSSLSLGGYFDTEEIIAGRVNLALNQSADKGLKMNLIAKLAWNLQAGVECRYDFGRGFGLGVGYDFRNTNSNIFNQEDVLTCKFREHSFEAFFGNRSPKNLEVKAGARFQMFRLSGWSRYLNFFAKVEYDSRDDSCFPERGIRFKAEGGLCPTVMEAPGLFGDISLQFSGVIPIGQKFALIASIDHRSVISGDGRVPYHYINWMGGRQEGRYFDRQFTFAGFNHVIPFADILTSATLDARAKLGKKHYLTASGAYAFDTGAYRSVSDGRSTFGAQLGYSYDSIIGPLSFNVNWSNLTERVGFYASIGYNF